MLSFCSAAHSARNEASSHMSQTPEGAVTYLRASCARDPRGATSQDTGRHLF